MAEFPFSNIAREYHLSFLFISHLTFSSSSWRHMTEQLYHKLHNEYTTKTFNDDSTQWNCWASNLHKLTLQPFSIEILVHCCYWKRLCHGLVTGINIMHCQANAVLLYCISCTQTALSAVEVHYNVLAKCMVVIVLTHWSVDVHLYIHAHRNPFFWRIKAKSIEFQCKGLSKDHTFLTLIKRVHL